MQTSIFVEGNAADGGDKPAGGMQSQIDHIYIFIFNYIHFFLPAIREDSWLLLNLFFFNMEENKHKYRYAYRSYGIVILDENGNDVDRHYRHSEIQFVRRKVYEMNGWKWKDDNRK